MNTTEFILEVLKISVPALIVFLTTSLILKRFFEKEYAEKVREVKALANSKVLPMRLQAHERMALYLERIDLNNSILKTYKSGMSARLLQNELNASIRSEFEHNVAQQVYLSEKTWGAVKTAKEETIKIINIAAQQLEDTATGIDFSTKVYEILSQLSDTPSEVALKQLRTDIKKYL